jgi:hypothetical protein
MAKKEGHEKGVGPYAGGDADSRVRRDSSGLGYPEPVDIYNRVQPSADRDGGFSGKLDRGPDKAS